MIENENNELLMSQEHSHTRRHHIAHTHDVELARAYIPFQHADKMFSPEEALIKGTAYPELYKPYHKHHNPHHKNHNPYHKHHKCDCIQEL